MKASKSAPVRDAEMCPANRNVMGNNIMAEIAPVTAEMQVANTHQEPRSSARFFASDCEPATVHAAIQVFSAANGSPTILARFLEQLIVADEGEFSTSVSSMFCDSLILQRIALLRAEDACRLHFSLSSIDKLARRSPLFFLCHEREFDTHFLRCVKSHSLCELCHFLKPAQRHHEVLRRRTRTRDLLASVP